MEDLELRDIADNLFILNKITVDRLFTCENPGDAFALYCFYYRQAKWKKTDTIEATNTFVKNGLHWGIDRINKAKNILKNLGLIEIMQRKENGMITKWLVRIHYIVSNNKLNIKVENLKDNQNTSNPLVDRTTSGFQETNNNNIDNKLKNNNIDNNINNNNAPENSNSQNEQNSIEEKLPNKPTHSEQKELSKLQKQREKNKEYYPLANKLKEYIEHVSRRKISDKTVDSYADTIRLLVKDLEVREDPKSDIEKVIEYLYTENQNNGIYAFVVESAVSLRQKFAKIEDKIKKKEIYKQNNSYNKNNRMNYAEMEKYIL